MSTHELSRRRTFGIISHPDAGKTTLTEKLLLFGGAIHTAGAVKSNKIRKTATSDFMEIEKQRGISVATSVMGFDYDGYRVTILDTPGHKDFAEDTYRTLTAVDSVILVIDAAKGIEEQTRKLMEVCRMRSTPVIVFINKLDREGLDPLSLLDDLEREFGIHACPASWPIGMGNQFQGTYDLFRRRLSIYASRISGIDEQSMPLDDLSSPVLEEKIGATPAAKLREDLELIAAMYAPFDEEHYREGYVAPVFFGSALNNFGIRDLLETFVRIAPSPQPRETSTRMIVPTEAAFTGFIFKIHANLDPNHRSRIAFCRVCSGHFQRGVFYTHTRLGRTMRFTAPLFFMANERELVEEAWPGDVIGLHDPGYFKIGDTLTEGEDLSFKGIPSFSPELFKLVVNLDAFKSKQLAKGIQQLTDEGVAQLFTKKSGNERVVGTVGELQYDVIKFRLLEEFGATADFRPMTCYKAFWVTSDDRKELERFMKLQDHHMYWDKDEHPVYLPEGVWAYNVACRNYPNIEFHTTSDFKLR
jgi:peptide chain release factor 3